MVGANRYQCYTMGVCITIEGQANIDLSFDTELLSATLQAVHCLYLPNLPLVSDNSQTHTCSLVDMNSCHDQFDTVWPTA